MLEYTYEKFEKIIFEYIINKSDFVLPISNWMKKELVNKIPENKMMPLPMGVNIKNFSPENRKNLRKKYQLNQKKVFLYVGTLDSSRNLEVIIEAFLRVKRYKNDICLLIVGSGNSEDKLKKLTLELGLNDNIIFTGQISYFDIPDIIFTADICLSPIPPIPLFKVSSPTKLFEYMAMEKPIIANKGIFEQEEILSESMAGILINFDSDSFAEGMIELMDNPQKSRKMGENGRKWVINNRNYKKMALDVEKLYFKLIK
jgi:glycosyltransferase involved in cell wall biosynthesis